MRIVNTVNLNKIAKICLVLFGFYITLFIFSYGFDSDLGWHLRFGKDAISGNFQYLDNYTWSYFGQSWVNHEWGGDLVFWLLYKYLGYFSLVVFTSLCLWLAFLLVNKIFCKKLTNSGIIFSILGVLAVDFIMLTRLAMLAPLFFVAIWYTLEKINTKKLYRLWPLVLWLWSFFHGSWILGFIVINIYLLSYLIQILFTEKNKIKSIMATKKIILWQGISVVTIMINPYGWKIWKEIFLYFTNNFYKAHITEWLPSYSYPVYFAPLFIASISVVVLYMAWKKKKATISHLLVFIAFFVSAFMYKRNNLFLVLICIPLLTNGWQFFISSLNLKRKKIVCTIIGLIVLISIVVIKQPVVRYSDDIWDDKALLNYYGLPVDAVDLLKKETQDKKEIKIFNEYGWGGYMVWTLPNQLVYLDGRSAATWKDTNGESMLKKQLDLYSGADGLKTIEKEGAEYVLLRKSWSIYSEPNLINKILFAGKGLGKLVEGTPTQLVQDLEKSKIWKQIYEDGTSILWVLSSSR